MSADFHEEDKLGKAYDTRLLIRLLKYVKPHKRMLAFSLLLVVLITGVELTGPFLIKVAIDDHINGLSLPMKDVAGRDIPGSVSVTAIDHMQLARERQLYKKRPEAEEWTAGRYQIVEWEGSHYLVAGTIERTDTYRLAGTEPDYTVITETGVSLTARLLSAEEAALFREQDIRALIRLAVFYFALISVSFLLNYGQILSLNRIAQRIILKMRQQLFSHLQHLSFRFFDRNPVGRLVTRVTNDTQTLNDMYSNVLVNLLKDLFMLVGIMTVMWFLDSRLAMLAYLTLPLIIGATVLYRKYAREAMREVRTRLARINASMNENISGMRIVQIFHREKQEYSRMEGINRSHFNANTRELHLSSLYRPVMDFIYAIGLAMLIWWGGGGIIQGALEFGVLYAFFDYLNRFFKPIQDMTEKYTILQQSMVSSERIFMLLDEKDDLPEAEETVTLERVEGDIRFEDVTFGYTEGEPVLHGIQLHIRPGQTVAFVGATGAGKSSIISLLCRFYDVQQGSVKLDGVDIRKLSKQELRRWIGVVQQDVFLFSEDIKSNIRLSREDISDDEIRRICEFVNADAFIRKLPDGYDTKVMERGITLSSGQRQLLSIARTLAFNPAVLVLDEATANIDTETELLIQDAFRKVSRNRTTLIIAHRLSTIQHADQIVVLHKGVIREVGTHQELLKRGGLYRKLYELQDKDREAGAREWGRTSPSA